MKLLGQIFECTLEELIEARGVNPRPRRPAAGPAQVMIGRKIHDVEHMWDEKDKSRILCGYSEPVDYVSPRRFYEEIDSRLRCPKCDAIYKAKEKGGDPKIKAKKQNPLKRDGCRILCIVPIKGKPIILDDDDF